MTTTTMTSAERRAAVWALRAVRGSQKLLLLALVEAADAAGVAMVALPTLAAQIGEAERHVRRLLHALEAQGLILRTVGGGRERPSRYVVVVGGETTASARARLVGRPLRAAEPEGPAADVQRTPPQAPWWASKEER